MAKQEQVSDIMVKLGARLQAAIEAHKNDETELGQIELPTGIRGGIAEVRSVTLGVFHEGTKLAGQPYFMAKASVREPKFIEANGRRIKTEGLFTTCGPEPLCDTPDRQSRQTFDEHVAWILNELRKMGLNTAGLPKNVNLAAICKAMVNPKKPIFIRFDTFGGPTVADPNARINHKWLGPADVLEIASNDDTVNEGAVDRLPTKQGTAPTANGKPGTRVPTAPTARQKPQPTPPPSEPVYDPGFSDNSDLDSLADRAMGGDEDAATELTEQATTMGYTSEQIEQAPTWNHLVNAIKSGQNPEEVSWEGAEEQGNESGTEEGEETPAWEPAVGEIYLYKPLDAKTKKPVAKAIEVEVTEVDTEARTITVKSLNNPKLKPYANVSWDDLISGDE